MKKITAVSAFLIAVAIIVGLIFSFTTFFGSHTVENSVSTTVEFVFDGAANGLDPNGGLFSFDTDLSDETIESVLNKLGWNEKYSIEDIKNSISIVGVYPESIIEDLTDFDSVLNTDSVRTVSVDDYYTTTYSVTVTDAFDSSVGNTELSELINAVTEEIKSDFEKKYAYNLSLDGIDSLFESDAYDYIYIIKLLNMKLSVINSFASKLYDLKPQYSFDGTSFNDIVIRCDNISKNYVDKVDINVAMNAITKDTETLINQYNHYIKELNYDISEYNSKLEYVSQVIDDYERDSTLYIGSGDSVMKISSDSGSTYDYLVKTKIDITEKIAELNSSVSDYQARLDKLTVEGNSPEAVSDMNKSISDVNSQIDSLLSDLQILIDDFNAKYIYKNSIKIGKVSTYGRSIFSASFIVTCIKCVGPFFVIALCISLLLYMKTEIKKYKKNN